jgi:4-hydroxy-2-oxoheptanedioate aldolase
MTLSLLADRLRGGETVLTAWCGIPDPMVPAALAAEDFDAVTLDMQHGVLDLAAAIRAIPLVNAAGKPALARLPVGDFASASKLLDNGASAVIAPMINTLDDARRFAAYMKYPPLGERSWGPAGALALSRMTMPDYLARANGMALAFAMVETREALSTLDDILAVPGLDGVLIGPGDLSIALSSGAEMNPMSPAVDRALDDVARRTRAVGKFAAVYATTGERARDMFAKGYHVCAVGSDLGYLKAGAKAMIQAAKG